MKSFQKLVRYLIAPRARKREEREREHVIFDRGITKIRKKEGKFYSERKRKKKFVEMFLLRSIYGGTKYRHFAVRKAVLLKLSR